jgi:hypothetical protein
VFYCPLQVPRLRKHHLHVTIRVVRLAVVKVWQLSKCQNKNNYSKNTIRSSDIKDVEVVENGPRQRKKQPLSRPPRSVQTLDPGGPTFVLFAKPSGEVSTEYPSRNRESRQSRVFPPVPGVQEGPNRDRGVPHHRVPSRHRAARPIRSARRQVSPTPSFSPPTRPLQVHPRRDPPLVRRRLWEAVSGGDFTPAQRRHQRRLGHGLDPRAFRLLHDALRDRQVPGGAWGRHQPPQLQRGHLSHQFRTKRPPLRLPPETRG